MDASLLQKLNRYKPSGIPDYAEGDLSTFKILASNNLLHRSLFKWDVDSLKKMTNIYPGKPLMLDHDWDNVTSQVGFIYDANLYYYANPSDDIKNYFLAQSPDPDIDSYLLSTEGLYQLVCDVSTETSHPMTNELTYGRKINASVGGVTDMSMICPLCETDFSDPSCPHLIPGYADPNSNLVAPYWIRSGIITMFELSMVMAGNSPSAQVLNTQSAQILKLA